MISAITFKVGFTALVVFSLLYLYEHFIIDGGETPRWLYMIGGVSFLGWVSLLSISAISWAWGY